MPTSSKTKDTTTVPVVNTQSQNTPVDILALEIIIA